MGRRERRDYRDLRSASIDLGEEVFNAYVHGRHFAATRARALCGSPQIGLNGLGCERFE
jgi:hypothetical protein